MTNFRKKSLLQLKKMSLIEVEKYYVELRKYDYDNNIPMKYIDIRKKIHKLLVKIVEIDRLISKEQINILYDKSRTTNKKIIYACTHIGGSDAQRVLEILPTHAYLFIADLREMYRDITGILLRLNGAVCLETNNKEDRKIAKERAIEIINQNANLLIFPEGAWNITSNLPVMDLYKGTADIAIATGAEIVPVAIEQYDNKYYIVIGQNIEIALLDSFELTQKLREHLAQLKWDIWESQGIIKRSDVIYNNIEEFQQQIIDRCPYGFTIEDVDNTRFKDKSKINSKEVFSFVKKLHQ